MEAIAQTIDRFNNSIGSIVAWLALPMVLVQFLVVITRYVFGYNSIWLQESVLYFHAFSFMLGAAAVLLRGGHVRVDIFYADMSNRGKAKADLFGVLVFLIPVCVLIIKVSIPTMLASWRVFEGSGETSGIRGVYLLKSLPVAMASLLLLQGISMGLRAVLVLMGRLDTHIVEALQRDPDLPSDGADGNTGQGGA